MTVTDTKCLWAKCLLALVNTGICEVCCRFSRFHNFHKTFINGKSKSGQFFQFHLNVDFSRSVVHLNVDTLVHLNVLTSILILFSTFYSPTNSKFQYLGAEIGVAGAAGQQSVLTVLSIWNCCHFFTDYNKFHSNHRVLSMINM